MDVTFNNVLEGTRQYFMGVPKASPSQPPGQSVWISAQPPEGEAPTQPGPPSLSRPPSTAVIPMPPRPPSEPLEPEPHIIHKATVMREALEKRRERPQLEDSVSPVLSPPPHVIRKPSPRASPARPPSSLPASPRAPTPRQHEPQTETPRSASEHAYRQLYRAPSSFSRQQDLYTATRPQDQYSGNRPPDTAYPRYHYDSSESGRGTHVLPGSSPQAPHSRQSPQQSYTRISSSVTQHAAPRLRDTITHSPPTQRYNVASVPPLHNDRVPPIHHLPISATQRSVQPESRSSQMYSSHNSITSESMLYSRTASQFDRHSLIAPRKYDSQQAYPGYRQGSVVAQPAPNHRIENQHHPPVHNNHVEAPVNNPTHYPVRPPERARPPDQMRPLDSARFPPRPEYGIVNREGESTAVRNQPRSNYQNCTPSTSSTRYNSQNPSVPATQNATIPQRSLAYRPAAVVPKTSYEYSTVNSLSQNSLIRPVIKTGYASPQTRMTVSVTSLVNQMNQTKHKRESPLDLSVKTVKNSADSSTTQEDADSSSSENKGLPLQQRPVSNTRHTPSITSGYITSHKVDFSPDFQAQYRDRASNHVQTGSFPVAPAHPPTRYNGNYEGRQSLDSNYPIESRHPSHVDHNKYNHSGIRQEYSAPRIDLTRNALDERLAENRRDDRHYVLDENRKRLSGPIVNNIPEKIVRNESLSADSRIDRLTQSAREQHELMSRPVYSYSSYKRLEAEQKRSTVTTAYRESNSNNRYPYNHRDVSEYRNHYLDRNQPSNGRHIIQKIPNNRDLPPHHLDNHSGVPADKRVLSILRNNLETKHTGFVEPAKQARHIPDLIVIDDIDDSVIEITDLTKDNEINIQHNSKTNITNNSSAVSQNIHIPKAVDSIPNDSDYQKTDNIDVKVKSPDNDVASRIRTKAELKVMPPPEENTQKVEIKQEDTTSNNVTSNEKPKLLPKSQKQHLFNQIREDNLRLESVIKHENQNDDHVVATVKLEQMSIDEIENDAETPLKDIFHVEKEPSDRLTCDESFDLDWATACDSFVEQLKCGSHIKKSKKSQKACDTETESNLIEKISQNVESDKQNNVTENISDVIIKQEPITDENEKDIIIEEYTVPVIDITNTTDHNEKLNSDTIQMLEHDITIIKIKKEIEEKESEIMKIKEEFESTDDDEPLIKSKILKEKEKSEQIKYQLLKELSEKSAYVKLECCDVDVPKNHRRNSNNAIEIDNKSKPKQLSKTKSKSSLNVATKSNKTVSTSSSDSELDDISVASRLRLRKTNKSEDTKTCSKSATKSPLKKQDSPCNSINTPLRKLGFGDGSAFHPGWEEELYRYKRSLRMPTRLIAIPRGGSDGPFASTSGSLFNRGSTSLPDLDPAPLSPAPSSAPSAATDDFFARRQDKLTMDSDLESNSSCSILNKLHYDSEASTSTIFSSIQAKKQRGSIVDVLIQKCGKRESPKKKNKDDAKSKVNAKCLTTSDQLSVLSLSDVKNENIGDVIMKKEKQEQPLSLDLLKKENNNTSKTTNEILRTKTDKTRASVPSTSLNRSDSKKVFKKRATVKSVFGNDRPASAPPSSCREEVEEKQEPDKNIEITKSKPKSKKLKDKLQRRSSSIRDGLRSTKSLKRNDAKGRLLRLKKRNSLIKSLANKRIKEFSNNRKKEQTSSITPCKEEAVEGTPSGIVEVTRKRLKRLFGRRKFSSGFDYIRKKKKIIKNSENANKVRKVTVKATPESEDDIHKEIKSWFINKSIGETPLHRAVRHGYTDCVAYCLEKLNIDPSSRDNAGFTPLHLAAAHGHVPIGRLLLQYGANVSAAAQGGIRPLHEASENSHTEMIRLLLSYGADPLLGTYSGQTPAQLAEGSATRLLRLHIADVQGHAFEPWQFPPPTDITVGEELGCDSLASPPPPPSPPPDDQCIEILCTEAPLPPFYSLQAAAGQSLDGSWCLLQDITSFLQIKSKESLLKQIHCGSGSPKDLFREIRTQDFLERAQCQQLLAAGEKLNIRASKVGLVRVTDKLRQLLKIETVLIS